MKKNMFFLLFSLLIVISLVMVGCSSTPTPAAPPQSTTNAAPPPSTSAAPSTTAAPLPTSAPASSTASATPTATAPANVITLRYNSQNSPSGWGTIHADKPWLQQITTATNGRVQIQAYYSQTLGKGPDAWNDTESGIDDMAWMFHGYWANMTPLADVVTLPFLPFKSSEQASGIFWQLFEKYPALSSEFNGNHVLIAYVSSPYFLITTKKQVKTLADIQGLKIRTSSGPPTEMMKDLRAVPMVVGGPDCYLDLQKGVIDGAGFPWEAISEFKLYEVVKYYTFVNLGTAYFSVAMNNAKWNSLPPDVQQEINSVSGLSGSQFWGKNFFDSAAVGVPPLVKQLGYPLIEYTLPQAELAKWSAIGGKPVWDDWVKKMTAAGHPEAQDILNTTMNLINTYNP